MALIDKDQLKAEIERLIGIHSTEVSDRVKRGVSPIDSENDTSMALIGQCHQLLGFLDTLQEQPELKPMNIPSAGGAMGTTPPKFKLDVKPEQPVEMDNEEKIRNFFDAMGDCGFSQDNILLLKSIWEGAYDADKKAVKEIVKTVHKEVTRQVKEMVGKQSVEGLDAEIERYWNRATGFQPKFAVLELTKEDLAKVASHFYEFGCRRTAEMYDDIEYNRQRAEEAGNEEFEKELHQYWLEQKQKGVIVDGSIDDYITVQEVARHFAEWGKNNLK